MKQVVHLAKGNWTPVIYNKKKSEGVDRHQMKAWNKYWEDHISTGYVLLKYTTAC